MIINQLKWAPLDNTVSNNFVKIIFETKKDISRDYFLRPKKNISLPEKAFPDQKI